MNRLWWAGLGGALGGLIWLAVLGWDVEGSRFWIRQLESSRAPGLVEVVLNLALFGRMLAPLLWLALPGPAAVDQAAVGWLAPVERALRSAGLVLLAFGGQVLLVLLTVVLLLAPHRGPAPWLANTAGLVEWLAGGRLSGVLLLGAGLLAAYGLTHSSSGRGDGFRLTHIAAVLATGASAVLPTGLDDLAQAFSVSAGVFWILAGSLALRRSGGFRRHSAPADAIGVQEVLRSFGSRTTLLSGAGMAVVLGFAWDWAPAVAFTVLMYLHEAGHVVFAWARGVRVTRAPTFIPGLGAFVQTAPRTDAWDEVWVALGGPLTGGVAAFCCRLVGAWFNLPALAEAGDLALVMNLINLAPLSPLDGGKVAGLMGIVGVVAGVAVAAVAIINLFSLSTVAIGALGLYLAYRSLRQPRTAVRWSARLGMSATYLCVGFVLLAALFSGSVHWTASGRAGLDRVSQVGDAAIVVLVYLLLSSVIGRWAWRPERSARARYGTLVLFNWWWHVWRNRNWLAPLLLGACAAFWPSIGQPWLARRTRTLAAHRSAGAGALAAVGYDVLVRRGRAAEAANWLERLTDDVAAAGGPAVSACCVNLVALGHHSAAEAWATSARARGWLTPDTSPEVSNLVAWQAHVRGRASEGLAWARAAVLAQPSNPNYLDTLGQTLVDLGEFREAETVLRRALELRERTGTRVALARAMAGQGRYAEASSEAEQAVQEHKGTWPTDEPSADQVLGQVRLWREALVSAGVT